LIDFFLEDEAGASVWAVWARLPLHARRCNLWLCQLLDSVTDPVRITDKAFMNLFLSRFIIKPDDRRATGTISTGCRWIELLERTLHYLLCERFMMFRPAGKAKRLQSVTMRSTGSHQNEDFTPVMATPFFDSLNPETYDTAL